jgi:hypothetical protein
VVYRVGESAARSGVRASEFESDGSPLPGGAGGDHLHLEIFVHGQSVDPLEWLDSKWLRDNLASKLRVPVDWSLRGSRPISSSPSPHGTVTDQVAVSPDSKPSAKTMPAGTNSTAMPRDRQLIQSS